MSGNFPLIEEEGGKQTIIIEGEQIMVASDFLCAFEGVVACYYVFNLGVSKLLQKMLPFVQHELRRITD